MGFVVGYSEESYEQNSRAGWTCVGFRLAGTLLLSTWVLAGWKRREILERILGEEDCGPVTINENQVP